MARNVTEGIGSGITMRTKRLIVLDCREPGDAATAIQSFSRLDRLNEPWGNHAGLIDELRTRYKVVKSELPSDPKLLLENSKPRSSEFWYLQQIVRRVNLVEKYVATRPWEAVSLSMELMELLAELSFKDSHEGEALEGRSLREGRQRRPKVAESSRVRLAWQRSRICWDEASLQEMPWKRQRRSSA